MKISDNLRQLRIARGLTQKDVAEQTGISTQSIINYENGRREPNSKAMVALESFFDVSGAYLRGENDDPAPKAWDDREVMDAVDEELRALPSGLRSNVQNCTDEDRKLLFDILVELRHITGMKDDAARRAALQLVLQVAHLSVDQPKV